MSPFNMDDYVSVADRIRLFKEKYPNGSLQGDGEFVRDQGHIVGYLYRAAAYRVGDDPRPGIGTAYEPFPGTTAFTKNSEVQNAETSAWGRAIVALGFDTKHIASADEVRGRQEEPQRADGDAKLTDAQMRKIGACLNSLEKGNQSPPESFTDWTEYAKGFINTQFGKRSRKDLTKKEAGVLIDHLEAMELPF